MKELKIKTYEGKAKTKNGVRRMISCGISVLLEFAFLFLIMNKVYEYGRVIAWCVHFLAFFLVLGIYSQYKTSTMKMPWIVLILAVPVVGVTLYLLVGLSGVTGRMRTRYEKIDEKLLPMLPSNEQNIEELKEKNSRAANISHYIKQFSFYLNGWNLLRPLPFWQDTGRISAEQC